MELHARVNSLRGQETKWHRALSCRAGTSRVLPHTATLAPIARTGRVLPRGEGGGDQAGAGGGRASIVSRRVASWRGSDCTLARHGQDAQVAGYAHTVLRSYATLHRSLVLGMIAGMATRYASDGTMPPTSPDYSTTPATHLVGSTVAPHQKSGSTQPALPGKHQARPRAITGKHHTQIRARAREEGCMPCCLGIHLSCPASYWPCHITSYATRKASTEGPRSRW